MCAEGVEQHDSASFPCSRENIAMFGVASGESEQEIGRDGGHQPLDRIPVIVVGVCVDDFHLGVKWIERIKIIEIMRGERKKREREREHILFRERKARIGGKGCLPTTPKPQ